MKLDFDTFQFNENENILESDYPINAFPPIVANAIKKSAFYHHVPLAIAAQTYLGQMAYIAQDKIDAPSDKGDSNSQPSSLFILTIFPSGEGKDVCKNDASKINRKFESNNMQIYKNAIEEWNLLPSKQRGEKPKNPLSIFKKATIQGIIATMANGKSNSFLWSTGEGGYLFGGYSLTSTTIDESLSMLNDLVDSGIANSILKNEENNNFFENKRFSLDIAVQDVIARPALNNEKLKEQGFLARVLFAASEPLPFRKITEEYSLFKIDEDKDLNTYWQLCEKFILLKNNSRYTIKKSKGAQKIHENYENYINSQVETNQKYAYIRPYAKRTNQYILRVAAVLAFWSEEKEINENIMKNAADLCIFSLNEWIRYYNKNKKSHSTLLWEWLNNQKDIKVLKSSILQMAPSPLRKKEFRDNAIQHLIDLDQIRIEKINKREYIVLNITV
ncbi:DUF3987 domain-containing protein [Acinetobacter baumannii]|uniref:DUF3987 domain-containing protein n=1 Tax=Acinetobacter baumannii TaxID=470 RepID=UPI00056DCE2D|nr:DUF3987 domain-containing protein [Acinetobacter baumannii]MDN8182059.1 DUF3987 domain-containing protein [Acinetobacter baumannii]